MEVRARFHHQPKGNFFVIVVWMCVVCVIVDFQAASPYFTYSVPFFLNEILTKHMTDVMHGTNKTIHLTLYFMHFEIQMYMQIMYYIIY